MPEQSTIEAHYFDRYSHGFLLQLAMHIKKHMIARNLDRLNVTRDVSMKPKYQLRPIQMCVVIVSCILSSVQIGQGTTEIGQ
jgi:hypothetical protein